MSQWPIVQLRRVVQMKYGDSLGVDSRKEGTVPVYGSNGAVGVHNVANTHGPVIVVGRKGSHGKLQWNPSPVFAIDTTYYIDGSCTGADLRWLYFALQTARLETLSQDVGVPGLSREQAYSQRIPMPSLDIQRAIANFLDVETARIDALIVKKRKLAGLLNSRYREERRTRVLRGLDPTTGFGLEAPGWRTAQLGVLISLQRGHDLPIDKRSDGMVPIISSGGQSGWHDEAAASGPGVVTGRYGTVGEVFYVEGPYWPLNTTLYVVDFRDRDPRWIYHLLSVLPLDNDSAKSAVTGINRNVIGILCVPVPPLDEQRRLAEVLDMEAQRLDLLTQRLNRQIKLLTEHRQALITAAVTGEIEVPGVAAI